MSKKMGRPKVPKAKLRGILIQARVSPEENKQIQAAIKRASENASEWVRKTLLMASKGDCA